MAQTGTGKTAAFLIPILQQIEPSGDVQALVVTPTRELAIQVCGEAEKLARNLPVRAAAIYGGTSHGHQRREIFSGVDIVVGTPGRLIDFVKNAILRMRFLKWLVLDEADRMLDMGFIDDIDFLCRRAPPSRQTMLFSATLPPPILKIAEAYMMNPVQVQVSPSTMVADRVRQDIYRVSERGKMPLLLDILRKESPGRCLIFTARRESTGEIMRWLREQGFEAARLSSLQEQRHREGIMDMFRRGEIHILVATDVAGRGIDIGGITHVINFDIPMEADDYVHRIGRTARAGAEGHAITFVTAKDLKKLAMIRRLTGMDLPLEAHGPDGTVVPIEDESDERAGGTGARDGRRRGTGRRPAARSSPPSRGTRAGRPARASHEGHAGHAGHAGQAGHTGHANRAAHASHAPRAAEAPRAEGGGARSEAAPKAAGGGRRRRRGGRGRKRGGGGGGGHGHGP
jgi:superfamily II DNA/RNA helicase